MKLLFKAVIPGRVMVKKNTQRVINSGRFKRVIYSSKFTQWEKTAMVVLSRPSDHAPIMTSVLDELMIASFKFYFQNHAGEADVSNLIEGPQDVLKKAGIIRDDILIRRVIGEKFFGEAPRVEIELYSYEGVLDGKNDQKKSEGATEKNEAHPAPKGFRNGNKRPAAKGSDVRI